MKNTTSALFCPSAFAFLLACLAAAGCNSGAARPAEIPIVRTFGDLLAVKPIECPKTPGMLADGGKTYRVRIGIEARRCEFNDGLLVYVLTENFIPAARNECTHGRVDPTEGMAVVGDERAGPLRVVVLDPAERSKDRWLRPAEDWPHTSEQPVRRRLFVASVVPHHEGPLKVLVYDAQDKLLAAGDVTAQGRAQPWLTFCRPEIEELQRKSPGDSDDTAVVDLIASHETMAVPSWKAWGRNPLYADPRGPADKSEWESRPIPPPGTALPRFQPLEPDGRLRITTDGAVVNVESDDEMVPFPEENFLVRWWVNGRPFCPRPQRCQRSAATARLMPAPVRRIRMKVQVEPADFGAKKGDTIRMQLLYSEHGWDFVGLLGMEKLAADWLNRPPVPPRLSNVAEFRVK